MKLKPPTRSPCWKHDTPIIRCSCVSTVVLFFFCCKNSKLYCFYCHSVKYFSLVNPNNKRRMSCLRTPQMHASPTRINRGHYTKAVRMVSPIMWHKSMPCHVDRKRFLIEVAVPQEEIEIILSLNGREIRGGRADCVEQMLEINWTPSERHLESYNNLMAQQTMTLETDSLGSPSPSGFKLAPRRPITDKVQRTRSSVNNYEDETRRMLCF